MNVERAQLAETSVREVIRDCPQTREVFGRFGLDTCCGAGASVRASAERDGADLDELLDALVQEIAVPEPAAGG